MPAWLPEIGEIAPWATGEHAFQQAAKAQTAAAHDRIRRAPTPLAAKRAARAIPLPHGWERRRLDVMLIVVRAKFADGDRRGLLLSTGDRLPAEDSPYEPSGAAATAAVATAAQTSSAAA